MNRFELFNFLMGTGPAFIPLKSDAEFSLLSPGQERMFVESCGREVINRMADYSRGPTMRPATACFDVLLYYARKGVGQ